MVPGILSTFAKEQLPCWLYKAEDGEDQEVPDLRFRLPYCYSSSVSPSSLRFGGIFQQAEDVRVSRSRQCCDESREVGKF